MTVGSAEMNDFYLGIIMSMLNKSLIYSLIYTETSAAVSPLSPPHRASSNLSISRHKDKKNLFLQVLLVTRFWTNDRRTSRYFFRVSTL